MRQDFIVSLILHTVIVAIMAISSPFKPRVSSDLGDVINVHLAALPAPKVETPIIKPATIPRAMTASEEIAVVPAMETIATPKKIELKKPEKKKIEDKTYQPADKGAKDQAGLKDTTTDVSENIGANSKLGGASVDNASFNYPYWYMQSFPKIERNWTNPVFANRPLKCVVYFQVIRSGRIIKSEIEQSSGVATYDRACLRAITLSEPLPPLPKEFIEEILGIHLEFPYSP
jgi:TonB family protein